MQPLDRPLDRIDHALLALLQEDARLANKELAARVGLAASTCHARVQRLIECGVVRGFHADVDPRAVGVQLQAIVFVQLESHGGSRTEALRDDLLEQSEVLQLFHVGGSQDLLLHVAVRDTEHLRSLVMDRITTRSEVRHIETSILFEHHTSPLRPAPRPS
jgi:DNA-binding Lrp family transcriptional regulator